MSKNVRRLFEQFAPENYTLDLTLDSNKMVFSGAIKIIGKKVGRPTKRITLHQKNLKILTAKITKHAKSSVQEIEVIRVNSHEGYDEVRLHTKEIIYPGLYTIEIIYDGVITKPMNGLYPCFFDDKGGKKKLLATQFESHHAREVFPCVDEPEAKATFDLTLVTPKDEAVLSNTPIKHQVPQGHSLQKTTFETTPVMSTYLLAFVVGELVYKEGKTSDGVIVRCYGVPDKIDQLDFSVDVTIKCLEFYNKYFKLDYPLTKCDLVALPDFASGAMENWGLITFREQCMLVEKGQTSIAAKQYVAMVIAHELAHQWFGNLVTMRWWTDLWLNEGFASWIEYLAIDHIFPDWNIWTQFASNEQQTALKLDALQHTHPVEVLVRHPDEIRTIFDAISYSKGASVIHMLNEYLGHDVFRDGLRHYLKTYAYKNTDTVDLWQSLEDVSKRPVKDFMHAWTSQSGFPIISVNKTGTSQQRFYINPKSPKDKNVFWPIPLLGGGPALLETEKSELAVACGDKLNQGQSGFYRVAYAPKHLRALGKRAANEELSIVDRLGLLADVIETSKAGMTSSVDVLKFVEHYRNESQYPVWEILSSGLGSMRSVMNDEGLRTSMKPFIVELTEAQRLRLGFNENKNDSYFDKLLRPLIVGLSAGADEPEAIKFTDKLFALDDHTSIDASMRSVVYNTSARRGDIKTFERLLALHDESNSSELRTTLVSAITGFKQPELISRALEHITSPNVRLQDVSYWVAYSLMNHHAKRLTWEWVIKNWQWLQDNLGSDLSFHRMPAYVARSFSDEKFINEYKKFFEPKLTPALERSYNQGLETIEWQSAWRSRDLSPLKKYFQ